MQINIRNVRWLVLLAMALAVAGVGRGWAQDPRGNQDDSKWHPTRAVLRLEDYAGAQACAPCHRAIFEKQKTGEMALSSVRPEESRALLEHPVMSFENRGYNYSLHREGAQVIYTVSDGHDNISEPLFIAIGANSELFYFQHHGEYSRAPINYSVSQGKLVLDGEFKAFAPASLEAALGRPITMDGLRECLRCHSSGTVVGDHFDLAHLVPGDSCESCHGPGAKHVAAMRAGKRDASLIFNPAHLRAEEELDFCGDCHHTIRQVKQGIFHGRTVIPQAYRLVESRCWNAADPRSRCTFCHDMHAPLVREATAQDAKCLACHAASAATPVRADHPGKACPVGQKDCAHCHMPKVSVAGSMAFTDHRIRIAPPGTPYPE